MFSIVWQVCGFDLYNFKLFYEKCPFRLSRCIVRRGFKQVDKTYYM